MAIAKFLGKSIATLLLLSPYLFLILASDPPFALLLLTLFALYSWVVVWIYADIKARDALGEWDRILFVPLLVSTSTFGLIIWFVWRPEPRRRAWYRRQQANQINRDD